MIIIYYTFIRYRKTNNFTLTILYKENQGYLSYSTNAAGELYLQLFTKGKCENDWVH